MKRPDWGNQRTGQPRCAQLMAKTWNFSPATCRTQQAVSTVLPSVGITLGLRNVARRVSPSGNLLTGPRGTQARYAFERPRVIEESTNRTIGTAIAAATRPLNKIPSFMSRPRRERKVSFDIEKLLRMLCLVSDGIRFARIFNPP